MQRLGFTGILTTKSWGALPYLQGGGWPVTRSVPAQRAQRDERRSKSFSSLSVARCLAVTSAGKLLALLRAAEGESSSARTSLGCTDTAAAKSPSAPAAARAVQLCGARVDLEPSPCRVGLAQFCLSWQLHLGPAVCPCSDSSPAPAAPAFICRSGRLWLPLGQGGCGAGPSSSVQTSSGCEHNSQGLAFEKQGDAAWPPWGTSKSVSLCTAEKARVFDGYPWTGPGTRDQGFE